ncbi:MAG: hypothetical protein A2622_08245 [Bdellovibrionales bacterium RIFCSPHIGHO2_01_FULL_40_29]|nr:MAG: hypothetical protein A2622_08245 [Bdellovibrionales bacterium RIFCSPHIGHO2_01_FULL_40_29]OFZ35486.1 MAG: hypothetical protein A3D17_07480 [Bdellovibrionales bacterium RIFCSPHIGHO2_02_FULL_40_15]
MDMNQFNHARLCLGLSRQELRRRIELGQVDIQILNAQLDNYSHEIKLDALAEKWLELNSLDQVDKFHSNE